MKAKITPLLVVFILLLTAATPALAGGEDGFPHGSWACSINGPIVVRADYRYASTSTMLYSPILVWTWNMEWSDDRNYVWIMAAQLHAGEADRANGVWVDSRNVVCAWQYKVP